MAPRLLLITAISLLVSCATVRPPESVSEPSTVLLLTHGISSSLVLADQDRRAVRFAYGDWQYYALARSGVRETVAAVLWPTPAALGRQVIHPADDTRILEQVGIRYDGVFRIVVERARVAALRERLESLFISAIDTRVYNPEPRLEFVRHPEPYSLVRNSNLMIARWLRELGADVSGVPLLPSWRVIHQERPTERPTDPMKSSS